MTFRTSGFSQKATFNRSVWSTSLYRVLLSLLRSDRLGAGLHLFGLVLTVSLPQEGGVVLKARGHMWMLGFLCAA